MGAALRQEESRRSFRERDLVLEASGGDLGAREALVEAFMPLIASMARRYHNSARVDRTELIQEGVVGLLRALERYDSGLGGPFWPYACWWVRQAMQRLVAELARPVVLSDRALRQLARVKDAHRDHLQARGMEPSSADLAARSGLTRRQVETLAAVDRAPRRFEEPIARDEEVVGTFGELVRDPFAEDEYDRVEEEEEIEEVRRLTVDLCERERAILAARFGLDGPEQTLRQIASRLHLSAERVRQIEERALGKLRDAASSREQAFSRCERRVRRVASA
jgi:RNA polymerase primary sigma factor